MKNVSHYFFTPASNRLLAWLTDPGAHVPEHVRVVLLGELFNSPKAVLMGLINGVLLNTVALILQTGTVFYLFMIVDVSLAVTRAVLAHRAARAAARGGPTPTDMTLLAAILWCSVQGAMGFAAMYMGSHPLQVLSAATVFGLTGAVCARHYAAPRLALLLVSVLDLPLVTGAALSGEPWLLVMLVQIPLYLCGTMAIVSRFQRMAITTLEAQHESHYNARHDPLTGLLNRSGLLELLSRQYTEKPPRFILFFLDLDGFKRVNDTFGHQIGDQLLRAVALRLKASTRSTDLVARFGGDEFIIVADNMPAAEGARFAEAIIQRVTGEPYLFDRGRPAEIGISIGYACCPEDGTALDELQGKADTALYEVKATRRGIQRRFTA